MQETYKGNPWSDFHGPNLGYLLEQYDLYLEDMSLVDESLRAMFAKWGAPELQDGNYTEQSQQNVSPSYILNKMKALVNVLKLAENIRAMGHLKADIYPLEKQEATDMFSLSTYGLTENDVREIPVEMICPEMSGKLSDGLEAIQYLKQVYTGFVGVEIQHIDPEERKWLQSKIETGFLNKELVEAQKTALLTNLYEAEGFEQFLQKTYVGQKRFSVEGLETLVPAINEIVALGAEDGMQDVMISMAHRGRLNVLAHVLEKPYEAIFSQFQHSKWEPNEFDRNRTLSTTGDVKYHAGDVKKRRINDKDIKVTLAYNPSHLEVAGTVVEGYTRAAQEDRSEKGYPKQDVTKALAVLVHGDAAFPGQGVVAETLNYSSTAAYQTGGTIHIIANNRIGFTTESEDSRSTRYSSDMAKGFHIPIFHVNADAPEATLSLIRLAFEYRQTFNKDILIDLIGYRRLGHNEMDEPMATNPVTYQIVRKHPTITGIYKQQLLNEKSLTEEQIAAIETNTFGKFAKAYENIDKNQEEIKSLEDMLAFANKDVAKVDTTVDKASLTKINQEILEWPENFNVFGKLKRILERRLDVFKNKGKVDWAHAEALAFATILQDGSPIRLTGQDSERGTFSHRNLVLSDEKTGEKYCPMHTLSTSNASFAIHNSVLSEAAILGFEYGYNVISPETLVLWEAQFGDFANGAQIILDQFISPGKAKWGQTSGVVMLLPHGYEGQGPEHSSARLERFLQLAAENNWSVANLSSSAQYFHILRRQAAMLLSDEVKPLVLMAPKSLLRHASAASYLEEFTNGEFQPIIEQPGLGKEPEQVERIVFTSGRLAVELSDHLTDVEQFKWLDIIRIEEIYPFPEQEIKNLLKKYKNLKEIIWTQEEPKNMGAWTYIATRLQQLLPNDIQVSYNGRPEMASPSEGDPVVHKKEQQRIINNVFTLAKEKVSSMN
ncbi:2-oxoglutarate dehydrogenase E1 component [Cytobacillus depressus]|uniref:2-oxoglutarate dehydrogenase E1 component n=1 Tax=Cytobacillus depressus TaxID=1602942 RepID=A0A6L3V259_9BACI|nr:2-oxoglutarate dehydrogenase E1 component [Cytobacillus depressus]KAB2332278.1 2-oxoglutarate dehydrogenase E1 component [Cytobacillus depressus]